MPFTTPATFRYTRWSVAPRPAAGIAVGLAAAPALATASDRGARREPQVVPISPDGRIRVLDDASAGARNPSAVALTEGGDIYVTNSALFSDGPSLQLIER